jgi:DNA-binding GntR family transcriptional regulator
VAAELHRLELAPDLVDQVYHALIDAISTGALAPGARITQEDLAAQLAVSRQPVLQALRLLKKDGLVSAAPGRGLQVAPLDAKWLANVYQVRSALDALAARLACAAGFAYDADLIARGRRAAKSGKVGAMIDADIEFHAQVYAAADNPLIEQSAQLHWRHIRRAMGAVLQHSELRSTVWNEHEAIARAIAARDARRAESLMRSHGEQAGRHLQARLSEVLQAQ